MPFIRSAFRPRPCPRGLYIVFVALFDSTYGALASRHHWILAGMPLLLLLYMTAQRFADIGWNGWLAVPYTMLVLTPYTALLVSPGNHAQLLRVAVLILQLPAMVWPRRRVIGSTDRSQVAGGSGFE